MRALLLALIATIALPATAAQAAVVTGGNVTWGVKQSFRNYVTSPIATGTITPSEGATQSPPAGLPATSNGGGPFRFPIVGGDEPGATSVSLGTRGKVRFSGHAGALDFTIFNVRVVVDGTAQGPCLVADADTRRLNGGGVVEAYRDVRFAQLNTTGIVPVSNGATTTWSNVPATLTTEGSPAFAGFYDPGTALDPVTFAYTKGAGQGSAAGSCVKGGSVVTVPPGKAAPPSRTAAPTVKLVQPTKGQIKLLARGKSVLTKVRVNRAGKVSLVSRGRIAGKTRVASRVSKRAGKPGVVSLRWKLGKSARRQLAKRGALKLRLTATLPGAKAVDRRFTVRAPR